jgi:hypothetical protein
MAASREKTKGATPLALAAFRRSWFHSRTTSPDKRQRSSRGSTDNPGRRGRRVRARDTRRLGEPVIQ